MCHNPLDRVRVRIVSNKVIVPSIYEMIVEAAGLCEIAKAGQFINLYCQDQSKLLPRPISICGVDQEEGLLRIVYAVVGEGTKEFAQLKSGNKIDILGPHGSGFDLEKAKECKSVLIVGGGVGTPPLLQLAKDLKKQYRERLEINIVLGFRDEPYLHSEFEAYGKVYLATDSGKVGYHGNVVSLMKEKLQMTQEQAKDCVAFSCGPTPMLKALKSYFSELDLEAEFSLEERMGCGFGGCVGCVVPIGTVEEFEYKKVCKDGPVFDYRKVIFP